AVPNPPGCPAPFTGTLRATTPAQAPAARPNDGKGPPVDPTSTRPDEERFSVRVRVVVTAHGGGSDGLTGISQKQVFVHNDPDLVSGYPRRVASVSTSSPVFANLDGKPGDEMILATDDGRIHAYRPDGADL